MANDLLSTSTQPSFISAVFRSHRVRGLVFLLASLFGLYYFFLNTTRHLSSTQDTNVEDILPPGFRVDIIEHRIQSLIDNNRIMVFSKSYCPYSAAAKKLLRSYTDDVHVLEVDLEGKSHLVDIRYPHYEGDEIKKVLTKLAHGHSTFPSIFLDKVPIGGSDKLHALAESGDLLPRLQRLGAHLKAGHPQ
ncbi:hypothetical protein DFQ27_001620 [Actinomortierella ambigua]|uniref:Glutaredoxin domain-containing protein n=1 Tax=Actinomortierella ambigua TaxID=1343610 RepID=A0A9P6QAZ1_9FUNG|nr:hypothetical protein DFQ27_001620 [Actinomortierella ambigua]